MGLIDEAEYKVAMDTLEQGILNAIKVSTGFCLSLMFDPSCNFQSPKS